MNQSLGRSENFAARAAACCTPYVANGDTWDGFEDDDKLDH
jgi:hypothetical protein